MPEEFEHEFGHGKETPEKEEEGVEKVGELDELTKKEIFSHLDEQKKEISDILKHVGDKIPEEQKEKLETLLNFNKLAFKQLEEGRPSVELVYMITLPSEEERKAEKLAESLRESLEKFDKDPKLSGTLEKKLFEKRLSFYEKEVKDYETKREKWVKKLGELVEGKKKEKSKLE